MSESRQDMLERLLDHPLGTGDSFNFRCTACGKCCRHREDILISPYDLNRMARYLNMDMGQVIRDYCVWFPGQDSLMPVVIMAMKGAERKCPLLEKGKCRIHAAKPSVCALYPLGRTIADDSDEIKYVYQPVRCGATDQEQTVAQWLAGYDLEGSSEWFLAWNKVLAPMVMKMHQLKGMVQNQEVLQQIQRVLLLLLYMRYDLQKDFMTQFAANSQEAIEMLNSALDTLRGEKQEGPF